MTLSLFAACLRLARELECGWEGAATSGTATTLVDTACLEPNDYWNKGTVFFISGSRANTTAVPTDWVLATNTLTIPSGDVIAAGATYLLLPPKWPRSALRRALNAAARNQGYLRDPKADLMIPSSDAQIFPSVVDGDLLHVEAMAGLYRWRFALVKDQEPEAEKLWQYWEAQAPRLRRNRIHQQDPKYAEY